mmetsp:Transcript_17514/g.32394  ORF Transcript_17514/g.32394 Transcript_17514/m.32394 type:complete len:214 (-) Transcript_17514:251-892(-)
MNSTCRWIPRYRKSVPVNSLTLTTSLSERPVPPTLDFFLGFPLPLLTLGGGSGRFWTRPLLTLGTSNAWKASSWFNACRRRLRCSRSETLLFEIPVVVAFVPSSLAAAAAASMAPVETSELDLEREKDTPFFFFLGGSVVLAAASSALLFPLELAFPGLFFPLLPEDALFLVLLVVTSLLVALPASASELLFVAAPAAAAVSPPLRSGLDDGL